MIRILTAMQREADALGLPCEVIGIGAADIPPVAPDDIIINVGYCGGDGVPVGTIVEPKAVIDAETGEWIDLDPHFPCQKEVCVTSSTFVTEPLMTGPVIYDMELAKLARIPCAGLYCLKIVSDELNEGDCESFNDEAVWARVRELVASLLGKG